MSNLYEWWNLPDDELIEPLIIFPHFYGISVNDNLPESSQRVLDRSIQLLKKYPQSSLFLVSSNFFWREASYELSLKREYLRSKSVDMGRVIDGGGIQSTLDEILRLNSRINLTGKEVVSVCDRIHARRVRYFWRKLAPLVKIKIAGVKGVWDRSMPSFFCRSDLRWLAGNILSMVLFRIFGRRTVAMKHIVKKK
jgi:hypothetical protein